MLRKLFPVVSAVIYNLFAQVFFLYADDLFLIAPSVHTLQIMLNVCETELSWLDKSINVNKSVCMRFGQRFDIQCDNLITDSGDRLKRVEECRYLGVYLVSALK